MPSHHPTRSGAVHLHAVDPLANPQIDPPVDPVVTDDAFAGLAAPDRLALIDRLGLYGHVGIPELDAVVTMLATGCDVPIAVITTVAPGLQTYVAEIGLGAACTQVPDGVSFYSAVVTSGVGLEISDATRNPLYAQHPLVVAGKVCAYAGEPLIHDGLVIGTVAVFDRRPRVFTATERALLRGLTQLCAALITLRASAAWDRVTGLATRTVLLDRTEQAMAHGVRNGEATGLVVLDIVGMAAINAALGSEGGDVVLRAVAERLVAASWPADSVARIGADEFVVLFSSVASAEEARARTAAVVTAASGPVTFHGKTVHVAFRSGLTTTTTATAGADSLLAAGEQAAAAGPRVGSIAAIEGPRAALVRELRTAIDNDQLVMHYHPTIDLTTMRMSGLEALVRWQHPERGLLPPAEFVPLAEYAGVIGDLGDWVLRTSAAQAAAWEQQGREWDVAINLSPLQMADRHFAAQVAETLAAAGASPGRIVLEVTESALLDQPHATTTLETLRASGIRLALDDFGTGYSSLSFLRRFPVDLLKIDRSFVSGLGRYAADDAIVASVVSLARNTGKEVIAEGVETEQHAELLRSLGVRQAQGFLWSRPLPADQLVTWADAFRPRAPLRPPPKPSSNVAGEHLRPAPGSAEERMMEMHADGASLHTIAAALNTEGRRTPSGVRWHVRSVALSVAAHVPGPGSTGRTPPA